MQPTNLNLKAIARDATLRGDTKTLFHALDLLEREVPIATFMDFCTELDELPRGILQHVASPAGSRRGILRASAGSQRRGQGSPNKSPARLAGLGGSCLLP